MRFHIHFNMRAPDWGAPATDLYAAALDMCDWADGLGFEQIMLSEHHQTTDGYLPSPIVMAAAIGARTRRARIKLNVVLATLMHPIHLAEDLAVADVITNGRLEVVLGAGYRKEEFLAFQVNWKRRPSMMIEAVDTLRKAWTGEQFEFRGQQVRVLPRPAQEGGPPLAIGGTSEGAARRAAQLGVAFEPLGNQFYDAYLDELGRLGRPLPEERRATFGGAFPKYVAVAADPEAYWAEVGRHVLHNANEYASYARRKDLTVFKEANDPDELLRTGEAKVFTPKELTAALLGAPEGVTLRFNPLEGGIPPELGWQSLRLFESEVLPHVRSHTSATEGARS